MRWRAANDSVCSQSYNQIFSTHPTRDVTQELRCVAQASHLTRVDGILPIILPQVYLSQYQYGAKHRSASLIHYYSSIPRWAFHVLFLADKSGTRLARPSRATAPVRFVNEDASEDGFDEIESGEEDKDDIQPPFSKDVLQGHQGQSDNLDIAIIPLDAE